MKGIVLLSGGLDSTLTLLKLLKDGSEVVPMFVDYNQWSLEGERLAVQRMVGWLQGHPLEIPDWLQKKLTSNSSAMNLLRTLETKIALDLGERRKVGSVWGRNIALVGLAAMWAYTHGNDYDFIALGLHQGDVGPDCKPGPFTVDLNRTLEGATKGQIVLWLPILGYTIEDIGRELSEFGIPWNLMYSCYWYPPCGYRSPNDSYRCPGCRRKALAMKAGGAKPEELLLPNCKEITYQSPLAEKVDY